MSVFPAFVFWGTDTLLQRKLVCSFFVDLVPVSRESGERERRTGTKLMAVFLQYICSKVNTLKGLQPGDSKGVPWRDL